MSGISSELSHSNSPTVETTEFKIWTAKSTDAMEDEGIRRLFYLLSEVFGSDSSTRITRGITVLKFSDKLSLLYQLDRSISFITRNDPSTLY